MNTFRANGKLLLTGEYLVLKGALALALPTRFGQTMTVETVCTPSLQWDAYKPDAKWFSATLNPDTLAVMETDDPAKAEKLSQILQAVKTLNHNAFEQGLRFETRLDFDPEWGLGSSSTLIANLATWADVNPYALLKMTFGGSGYDIACATAEQPIYYQLGNVGTALRQAQGPNPIKKLISPLTTFCRAFFLAGSKAVSTCLILDITMVHMVGGQRGVKQHGVMVFHNGVVDTVDNKDGRTIVGDMTFQRQGIAHYRVVLMLLAKQCPT